MKKRNLLVLILVLLLVVVLILWFLLGRGGGEPVSDGVAKLDIQEEIAKCEKEKAYYQARCFSSLAKAAKDPLLCERVSEVEDIAFEETFYFIDEATCLADVAGEFDYDVTLCDQVKDVPEQYDMCFDLVMIDYVDETHDISKCAEIRGDSYWKANCLSAGVDEESEVGVCDQLSGDPRAVCFDQAYTNLAMIYEDVSFCDKSDKMPASRPTCIAGYAKKYDDLGLCDGLGSDESVCICYNDFFEEVNSEVCEGLGGVQSQNCQKCLEMDLFENL